MAERLYYDKINEVRNDSRFSVSPPPLPVKDLRIELSNFCNHQCIFCAHRKMTRPKKQMDEKFLFRILQEAYDAGFRGLGYYASGEPFMSPKLAEYVKRAKDIGYEYVYIDSNGAAVNFGRIKEVIDAGLDSIKFSINGTDRDTYKLIHGRDDFEKVISNLKQTWEYKQRLDRKLNVFVSFAVTRFTEDTLDSFLKEYSKYADDIITADVIDMGGYVPEVREYLRTKKQTDFMKGMSVPCYTLWNTFIITCEGYVTACCADFQNYFVYADLNKESILEAWQNETITKLRKAHIEKKISGTPCESCIAGKQMEWKPVLEQYASKFDSKKMFDTSDAKRRIEEYEKNMQQKENGLRGRLKFTAEVKDYAKSVVERLRRDGKKFVQFGAGTTGTSVVRYLKKNGLNPICFCDNNPMKQGTELDGLPVLSLDSVKNEYGSDFSFVISCNAFKEISKQLIKGGIHETSIICFEPDWLNLPQGQGAYIQEHLDDFEEVYDMLADEKSKDVFCGLLNFKITHDLGYISGLPDDLPYFDGGLYKLNEDMVFLDCGAFIGDTLQDFIRVTNGKYGRVACFEPNPDNARYIRAYINKNKLGKVDLFEYGVSDKKQRLSFGGASDAGRIQKDGNITIECDSIDNLCFEKYPKVDLIKMDIEGSEYWALKGASEIIQRDKPILAVCVYHKQDDFFVLPKLIRDLNPNYKIYFRQYELSGQETVCIAVPLQPVLSHVQMDK